MNQDFKQDNETGCERCRVSKTCTNIICNLREFVLQVSIIFRIENQSQNQITGYNKLKEFVSGSCVFGAEITQNLNEKSTQRMKIEFRKTSSQFMAQSIITGCLVNQKAGGELVI